MKHARLVAVALVLILSIIAWWTFGGGVDAPAPDADGLVDPVGARMAEEKTDTPDIRAVDGGAVAEPSPDRQALTDEVEDPLYARSMAGFRGRLVLVGGTPAAARLVRFYRMDAEVVKIPHLRAKTPFMDPKPVTYETRTSEVGRFKVTGVWPRSHYLMVGDAEGERQRAVWIERTPGAGEIIDLGDIVLPECGVISGRCVDESGAPAAHAWVRVMDMTGTILDAAGVQRLDPSGGVIVDEHGSRVVMTIPRWIRAMYEMLPVRSTRADATGAFVVRGVQPGSTSVIVNFPEHEPLVVRGVRVTGGEERDLGRLTLKEGETAVGRVVDEKGEPIAGAEVLLATKQPSIPIHFGSFANRTNEKGVFQRSGMERGPLYAAVRRSPAEAWTVCGPVSVGSDLIVRLPRPVALTLDVQTVSGAKAQDVHVQMVGVPGENGPGLDLASFGVVPWLDVRDQTERLGDGRIRVFGLIPGDYSIAIHANDLAPSRLNIGLTQDTEWTVVLRPVLGLDVRVLDAEERPIRNASIYAIVRGTSLNTHVQNMPVSHGTTDREGRLRIENCQKGDVLLTATHPAYGMYHKWVTLPMPGACVINMAPAGIMTGLLAESGSPPKPGKWVVRLERVGPPGAMPPMSRLAVADSEGRFRVNGLAPGKYRVGCLPSIAAMGWLGGLVSKFDATSRVRGQRVAEVTSGCETFVRIDAARRSDPIGDAVSISGTVTLDGRPGEGMRLVGWSQSGPVSATVDASGRFDAGRVAVGNLDLRLRLGPSEGTSLQDDRGGVWRYSGEVDSDRHFKVVLETGRLAGVVTYADGSPAVQVKLEARGHFPERSESREKLGSASLTTVSDASGRFEFHRIVQGDYTLRALGKQGYGRSGVLQVRAGRPVTDVRLTLGRTCTVQGRVDLSVYPSATDYIYVEFHGVGETRGTRVYNDTGEFRISGLPAGEYSVQIKCWGESGASFQNGSGSSSVSVVSDTSGLVITPVFQRRKQND